MPLAARYVHTNIVAKDWRALVRFYEEVFGCEFIPPERDLHGPEMAAGTGIPGAALRGAHLRMPGYGTDGPVLEIFTYTANADRLPTAVNRLGFGHLAFLVPDVYAAREAVLAAGGGSVGETVTVQISATTQVTWCYMTDPEGNVVELQTRTEIGA
jgi:predicted enzyme related to lactoylglutathione lyase